MTTLTFEELKYYLCEEIEEVKQRLLNDPLTFEEILSDKGKLRTFEKVLKFVLSPTEQEKFRIHNQEKKRHA